MAGIPAKDQGPTLDDIASYIDDPRYTIYIMMHSLIGAKECVSTLEYTHFPPGTTKSDDFKFSFVFWEDMTWFVVGIPTDMSEKMDSIARECSLIVIKGSPVMLRRGVRIFPYRARSMFTLMYQPGHPAFRNDPLLNHQLQSAEEETQRRIFNNHHRAD